jgi:hypothetical protein
VLSRDRTAAALLSAMSTRVDAGTMAAAKGAAMYWARTAATLMSTRSTSVDAGTIAAAGGCSAARTNVVLRIVMSTITVV